MPTNHRPHRPQNLAVQGTPCRQWGTKDRSLRRDTHGQRLFIRTLQIGGQQERLRDDRDRRAACLCGACFGALYNGLGPCRLDAVANMRAEVEISLLQDFPLAQALGALLVSADDWEIIMHCRSVPLTYGVLMTRVLHNGRKFKQATLKTPSLDKCASRKSTRRSTSGSLNARGSACELVRAPFLYRFPLFHPCFVSQKAYAPGFRSIPRPAKQGRRAPAHDQRRGAHHSQTAELCFFDI